MFKLNNASYSYDGSESPALSSVSLEIGRGEAVAITGSNGCGKTTLLKTLNGLAAPTSGEYFFDGARIDRKSLSDARFSREFHRRVGYVFQNADSQLFCGSVEDEIAFGVRQLELDEAECARRVDDCLELLDIEALRRRAPYALSGGEKRKVAFACVLALNPDALTADEPLASLDDAGQAKVLDLFHALKRAGKTLVFATHSEALVKELADVRVRMAGGKIVSTERLR